MLEMRDGRLRESCGVFGIVAPGEDVARLTFFGLYALQHRGQESAGIATCDGHVAYVHKGMGLVAQVFNEDNLRRLRGFMAIGHTRYSTTGASTLRNAQPYVIETALGPLAVAHNGNLTNAPYLRQALLQRGVGLTSSSDSEVITQMLAGGHGDWTARIRAFMAQAEGAYALVILTRDGVYGVRDPWGFRPLCLGRLENGYCLASESCALGTIGATLVRDIAPGEIVRLTPEGVEYIQGRPPERQAFCTFEYIYFARPDSLFGGRTVHEIRQELGRQLAREAPADADLVIPVPDSSIPHAIGYARESGLPFSEGLIKNRYIGRTFIQPTDRLRRQSVALKYNPLSTVAGKRVVLVDDSIVRGNTAGPLVRLLRQAGAREVHVRVASPPIRFPCFMGIDMPSQDELIAATQSVEAIREHIGADSLAYLSLEGLMAVLGQEGFCNACFHGEYPLPVHATTPKEIFEGAFGGWD